MKHCLTMIGLGVAAYDGVLGDKIATEIAAAATAIENLMLLSFLIARLQSRALKSVSV